MKRILLKYTLCITAGILFILILHLNYGTTVASVPVSVSFYTSLAFLTGRALLKRIIRQVKPPHTNPSGR